MKKPKRGRFLQKSFQWIKKQSVRKKMLAGITAAAVAVATIGIPAAMKSDKPNKASAAETRVVSAKVTEGSISTTVTGTGTLAYGDAIEVRIPDDITIDEVLVKSGDTVTEGQALATIEKQSLAESISDIQDSISDIDADIEALDDAETEETVTTAVGGRVKTVNISAGNDVTEVLTQDMSLITISADGSMAVDISDTSRTKGTNVTVTLADGTVIDGAISQVTGTKSVITIPDQYGTDGETVYIHLLDGTSLGIGTLYISQPYQITASGGTVSSVYVAEGETVAAGDSLFYLTDIYDQTELNRLLTLRTAYVSMLEERVDLLSNLTITSPQNGIIAEVYVEADEEVSSDKSSSESKSSGSNSSSASQVSSGGGSTAIQNSGIENNGGMAYPVLAFRNIRSLPTVRIASPEIFSAIEEVTAIQTAAASVTGTNGSGATANQDSETPTVTSDEGNDTSETETSETETSETDEGDSEQNSSEESSSGDNSSSESSSEENSSGESSSSESSSSESSSGENNTGEDSSDSENSGENSNDTTAISGTVKIPLLSPLNGVEMKVSALNSAIEDLFDDVSPYLVESMDWEDSEVCLVFKASPGYFFDGSANNTIEIIDDASETDYSWSYKLTLEDDGRTAYDTMTVKITFSEEEDSPESGSSAENSSDTESSSESSISGSESSSNSNSSDSKTSSNSSASDSTTGSNSSSSDSKSSSGTATSGSKSSSGSSSSGSKSSSGSSSSGSKSSSGSSSSSSSASSSSGSSQDLYEQSRTTAFTLQNSDEMQVTITVDELDILSISEGQEVSISLDAIEGQTFAGKVSAISSGSSSGGVSKYSVDIVISREESMLSGMTASAVVTVDSAEGVLTVPAAAIQESRGESYVYTELDEEGAPAGRVNVETGLSDGSRVQVTGELTTDQMIYYTEASGTEIEEDEEKSSENERRNQMGSPGNFEGSGRSGDRPSGGGNRPSGGGSGRPGGGSN